MLPDVQKLLDLQEIDRELIDLKSQLARYPVVWEETKKRMAQRKADHAAARKKLEENQDQRKRKEQRIKNWLTDLQRSQTRLSLSKTEKEYQAANRELEKIREKLQKEEDDVNTLVDEAGQREAEEAEERKKLDEFKEFYQAERQRIRSQFNDKKERVTELEREREARAVRVRDDLRHLYERVHKMHPGSAVVPVRGGSCTGCHYSLLPDVMVTLHRGEELVICPNCGRILAYDEDYVPEEEDAAVS